MTGISFPPIVTHAFRIGQQIRRPCRVHRLSEVAPDEEEAITFPLIYQGRLSPLT
jgi:hypothetical protein